MEVSAHAGQIDHGSIPAARRSAGSPTPERCRIAGVPYAPAESTTVSCDDAHLLAVSPNDHLDAGSGAGDAVAERPVEDRQVRAATRRVEVRERGVDPDARVDVDGLDPEPDAAVEVVEVVRARDTERRRRIEAGAVKRPDLVLA